jgi:hypothetical protein
LRIESKGMPTWFTAAFAAALLAAPAQAAELRLRVGERRVVAVRKAQGLSLDNPAIAEARILNATQIELVGTGSGEGKLFVVTGDGKSLEFEVHVTGPKRESQVKENGATDAVAQDARFGGRRIARAQCDEPLSDPNASSALDEARSLLKKERFEEAIRRLDDVLRIRPDAAFVHLFLGAAWARLKDQARGAYHYETFALSCPDDPKVAAVVLLLRDFERQSAQQR